MTDTAGTTQERHGVYLVQDDDDFWHGTCLCGWESAPMPDGEDVADAYGDHRAVTAVNQRDRLAKALAEVWDEYHELMPDGMYERVKAALGIREFEGKVP